MPTWHPERSPSGPIVIIVSIPEQRAYVYRNGVRIGASTVSTGKRGHETPTGVFGVLEKDKHRVSSADAAAPMPYLAGRVRVPAQFAQRVYDLLEPGASLVITDRPAALETRTQPGFRILADARDAT